MRAPSLKDVAQRAGVSVTTVSRFLNGTLELPLRTRDSIEGAIRDLNYVPNQLARRLSRGRSDVVGLVVPDIATPFFGRLVAAVEAEADRRGLSLALHATLNRAGRERSYLASVKGAHVDGVIFVTNHAADDDMAEIIDGAGRVVLVDEDVPGARAPRLFADNELGGYLAGRHLAEAGHSAVLFVGAPDDMMSGARRFAGLRRAMADAWGGAAEPLRYSGDYTLAFGRAAGERFLAEGMPATAILAASDELVIGLMEVLTRAGVRIPRDLSLVGFDDVGPLRLFSPPVTAIRQPVEEMGRRAMALLLDTDWSGPDLPGEELLPVILIERDSVAPPIRSTNATGHREDIR